MMNGLDFKGLHYFNKKNSISTNVRSNGLTKELKKVLKKKFF